MTVTTLVVNTKSPYSSPLANIPCVVQSRVNSSLPLNFQSGPGLQKVLRESENAEDRLLPSTSQSAKAGTVTVFYRLLYSQ